MRKYRYAFMVYLLTGMLIQACGSDSPTSSSSNNNCNLVISPTALSASNPGPFNVTYEAKVVTGTITVDDIKYLDANGNIQTINKPTLPWMINLSFNPGDQVSISASANVTSGGRFEIRYTAIDNAGARFSQSRFCES